MSIITNINTNWSMGLVLFGILLVLLLGLVYVITANKNPPIIPEINPECVISIVL